MAVDDSSASGVDQNGVDSNGNAGAAGNSGAAGTVAPAATAAKKRRSDTNGNITGGAKKRHRNGVGVSAIEGSSG